jgi:hypothetical protein
MRFDTPLHLSAHEVSFTAARRTTLNAHYTDPVAVILIQAGG